MELKLTDKITPEQIEYIDLLTEKSRKALFSASADIFGQYWNMTLQAFFECSTGQFNNIFHNSTYSITPTIGEYVWMVGFKEFLDEFEQTMKGLTIEQTANEKEAQSAMLPITLEEGMRIFCQKYFGLPSFKATDTLTMEEYLIARKADYNSAAFERKLAALDRRDMRNKK